MSFLEAGLNTAWAVMLGLDFGVRLVCENKPSISFNANRRNAYA